MGVSLFSQTEGTEKQNMSENPCSLPCGTPQQVAGSSTLECCRVTKYWKLVFPLGDVSWKVSAGRQQYSGSVSALFNGIQQNCMAFPMMGPDLPDHHLYHGHYPTRSTVKSFCSTSCFVILIPSFSFLHGLCCCCWGEEIVFAFV